jgi:hypothetical protein
MTATILPESFTHGSSEQRVRWFKKGMETTDLATCDMFSAQDLQSLIFALSARGRSRARSPLTLFLRPASAGRGWRVAPGEGHVSIAGLAPHPPFGHLLPARGEKE